MHSREPNALLRFVGIRHVLHTDLRAYALKMCTNAPTLPPTLPPNSPTQTGTCTHLCKQARVQAYTPQPNRTKILTNKPARHEIRGSFAASCTSCIV